MDSAYGFATITPLYDDDDSSKLVDALPAICLILIAMFFGLSYLVQFLVAYLSKAWRDLKASVSAIRESMPPLAVLVLFFVLVYPFVDNWRTFFADFVVGINPILGGLYVLWQWREQMEKERQKKTDAQAKELEHKDEAEPENDESPAIMSGEEDGAQKITESKTEEAEDAGTVRYKWYPGFELDFAMANIRNGGRYGSTTSDDTSQVNTGAQTSSIADSASITAASGTSQVRPTAQASGVASKTGKNDIGPSSSTSRVLDTTSKSHTNAQQQNKGKSAVYGDADAVTALKTGLSASFDSAIDLSHDTTGALEEQSHSPLRAHVPGTCVRCGDHSNPIALAEAWPNWTCDKCFSQPSLLHPDPAKCPQAFHKVIDEQYQACKNGQHVKLITCACGYKPEELVLLERWAADIGRLPEYKATMHDIFVIVNNSMNAARDGSEISLAALRKQLEAGEAVEWAQRVHGALVSILLWAGWRHDQPTYKHNTYKLQRRQIVDMQLLGHDMDRLEEILELGTVHQHELTGCGDVSWYAEAGKMVGHVKRFFSSWPDDDSLLQPPDIIALGASSSNVVQGSSAGQPLGFGTFTNGDNGSQTFSTSQQSQTSSFSPSTSTGGSPQAAGAGQPAQSAPSTSMDTPAPTQTQHGLVLPAGQKLEDLDMATARGYVQRWMADIHTRWSQAQLDQLIKDKKSKAQWEAATSLLHIEMLLNDIAYRFDAIWDWAYSQPLRGLDANKLPSAHLTACRLTEADLQPMKKMFDLSFIAKKRETSYGSAGGKVHVLNRLVVKG